MNRREFIQTVGGVFLASQVQPSYPTRAIDLVNESVVVDMLHQIVYRFDQADILKRWLYEPGGFTQEEFDHVSDLVGIEHAGIGSDFGLESNDHVADRDQFRRFMTAADKRYRVHAREAVEDLDHPLRFYTLTEALIRRGYTNEHIKLVIGGNFQRVLSQVWR